MNALSPLDALKRTEVWLSTIPEGRRMQEVVRAAILEAEGVSSQIKLEFYAVVTQYDGEIRSFLRRERERSTKELGQVNFPEGPIIHETYVFKAGSLEAATRRAASMGDKLGWAKVARVILEMDVTP